MHTKTHLKPATTRLPGKLACLAYSVLCYLFFLLVFAYLIGFVGTIGVPKGIDTGISPLPWAWAAFVDVLLISLFAVQHSGMARRSFKAWLLNYVPAPIERATYVLLSSLVLVLMFWLWQPIGTTVWNVESPIGRTALTGVYWLGWGMILLATFLISHFELFGLKQALEPIRPGKPGNHSFRTPLLYRFVRHPMYLGFLLAFWATPHMTVGHLVFALMSTLYIIIGTQFEEKDLVAVLGDHYRHYQKRVGMLVPFIGRKKEPRK